MKVISKNTTDQKDQKSINDVVPVNKNKSKSGAMDEQVEEVVKEEEKHIETEVDKKNAKLTVTFNPNTKKKDPKPSFADQANVLSIVLSIRHLSVMLKSGLALEDAINVLSEQTTNLRLRYTYKQILLDIHGGMSISDAMKKHPKVFTEIIISLVNAGEQGGSLEKNLIFLADYLKKDYELQKKIKGALFYPLMVFGITVVEGMGVVLFIMPKLETLFTSVKSVSPFTLFVIHGSKFLQQNLLLVVGGLLGLFILLKVLLSTKPGRKFKDWNSLHFPILKVLKTNTILTTFSRTLGILLESGIPLANALQISSHTIGNHFYEKMLIDIYENVKKGQTLAMSMEKYHKFFPGTFIKMIEVGEQTGTLEENLLYLHEFYAEDVEEMSNNLTTLLEPLLLVFIGVMIGGLAISIVGPIYSLTSSLNSN